jgi:hypothetical protein
LKEHWYVKNIAIVDCAHEKALGDYDGDGRDSEEAYCVFSGFRFVHPQGRIGRDAIFHSQTRNAIIMIAPTISSVMTTELFHAKEVPPPEIGTWY